MAYENLKAGTAALASGAKEIADPNLTASSKVYVTNAGVGGTIGILSVAVTPGSSFIISSANVLDTSTVNYLVVY